MASAADDSQSHARGEAIKAINIKIPPLLLCCVCMASPHLTRSCQCPGQKGKRKRLTHNMGDDGDGYDDDDDDTNSFSPSTSFPFKLRSVLYADGSEGAPREKTRSNSVDLDVPEEREGERGNFIWNP